MLNKLKNVSEVIVHGCCHDGTAAAFLIHQVLPDAQIIPVRHDDADKLAGIQPHEGQLWVDICPPDDRIEEFLAAGVMVLDHHGTRAETVRRFQEAGNGFYADNKGDSVGVSGALLALRFVVLPLLGGHTTDKFDIQLAERFANLVGVRDTYLKDKVSSETWDLACQVSWALHTIPLDSWLGLVNPFQLYHHNEWWSERVLGVGARLHHEQLLKTEKAAVQATHLSTPNGTKVAVVWDSTAISDTTHHPALKDVDLVMSFHYEGSPTPHIKYELRSADRFPCGDFARSHKDGGGHPFAAGYTYWLENLYGPHSLMDHSNPIRTFMRSLSDWEWSVKYALKSED